MNVPGPNGRDRAVAERAVAWRRARREVARRLHPDVGGDALRYLRALEEVDRSFGIRDASGRSSTAPVTIEATRLVRAGRRVRRVRRRGTRAVRAVRARLPRGAPGARRYTEL